MIVRALTRGLAYAGRVKGLRGDEDEVAVESAARIASDMILAGRGADVLALYIQAAPKSDDGAGAGGDGPKSPLARALERLPGMGLVPGQSRSDTREPINPADSPANDVGTTDPVSVAPFFAPQLPLIAPSLEPLPASVVDESNERGDARARAAAGAGTPYPRGGASPQPIALDRENFEKNPASSPDAVT